MRILSGFLAAVVSLGFMVGEASAFVVSQTGPVITSKCSDGKSTEGCSWCTKSNKCYVVSKCKDGKCTVEGVGNDAKNKGRGTVATPIKTTTTGDKAPVTAGKPVREVPVSIVRDGGSSKKK